VAGSTDAAWRWENKLSRFQSSGMIIEVSKVGRSRIEYLIPTNSITVFDSYFNFTSRPKSNFIDRL